MGSQIEDLLVIRQSKRSQASLVWFDSPSVWNISAELDIASSPNTEVTHVCSSTLGHRNRATSVYSCTYIPRQCVWLPVVVELNPFWPVLGLIKNACQTSRTLNGSWGNIGMSVMHGAEKSLCAMVRQYGFLVLRIKTIAFRVCRCSTFISKHIL